MKWTGRITSKEFWDANAADIDHLDDLSRGTDPLICRIMEILQHYLPNGHGKTFFEVGCYPGRFLAMFSKRMGYLVSGIDYTDKAMLLPEQLRKIGVNGSEILINDFFKLVTEKQYDVVGSFGFIEHFTEPEDVINRHTALVHPGGYLVIGVPNLNNPIHKIISRKLLSYHYLGIMDCDRISDYVRRAGFEVIFSDYIINFPVNLKRNIYLRDNLFTFIKIIYFKIMTILLKMASFFKDKSVMERKIIKKWFPGYILCIARKNIVPNI